MLEIELPVGAPEGLRRAVDQDVPPITAIARAAYGRYLDRIVDGPPPLPYVMDYGEVVRDLETWVVERERTVRAFLALDPEDDALIIDNIAVDPTLQRSGLGRALMAFAERRAHALHFAEVRLFTHAVMTENQHWYLDLGYQVTDRRTVNGRPRVYMAKRI